MPCILDDQSFVRDIQINFGDPVRLRHSKWWNLSANRFWGEMSRFRGYYCFPILTYFTIEPIPHLVLVKLKCVCLLKLLQAFAVQNKPMLVQLSVRIHQPTYLEEKWSKNNPVKGGGEKLCIDPDTWQYNFPL